MIPAPVAPGRWDFDAIGTAWRIDSEAPVRDADRAAVLALVDAFDRDWSRFRADSTVSRLATGGTVAAPRDAEAMLGLYDELADATDGSVNPLVGDAVARRGYDASYSMRDGGASAAPERWREVVELSGGSLTLHSPATIDVGALGKGRLVDLVRAELRRRTTGWLVVDASGDLAVDGVRQRVALEHPYDPSRALGVWTLDAGALCASATNRRAWGDGLHHVLDARTGEPVREYAATWAVAADAMTADAVATALFFDGGPRFAQAQGASWVRMRTDGSVEWSPHCEAELFV
ncbi:FAD:protein FMN transferase [Microbacterium sp. H37-C3]|uniref:FAD:protein FMN transferase n=1 Tax=Microbacterium sp. H37-C3 TaxID=3004354 RepID=UPI0022AF6D2F|nr:FAD:protein FMN transferase [Microbacterium sp. H37-C3]MCZ4066117.1 FAD:protein FMN transferase [Microbacterium sp. H37-C3]